MRPIALSDVFCKSTKTPPTSQTSHRIRYRYFRSQGFKDDADQIKRSRCPAFTPAVVFNGTRTYKHVELFTGYSLVDIDKQSEEEVARMMERLKDDPYWLLAYVTLSGKGKKGNGDEKYIGVEEIEAMLKEQADFRQNEITRFVEIRWKDGDGQFKQFTPRDEGTLWSRINKQRPMKMTDMKTVLCSEFIPLIHPFKEYFHALPPWQEGDTDYIGALADTVTLADETPEMKRIFRPNCEATMWRKPTNAR